MRLGREGKDLKIEKADVFMSLVVPAFNEEDRLGIMLREAVDYLEQEYGALEKMDSRSNGSVKRRKANGHQVSNGHAMVGNMNANGWEILVVSDGSTDKTVDVALSFAKDLKTKAGSSIRVIQLHENRGKGGATTHGMRHVRGEYAIFADADGASKFEDLGKLVRECKKIEDDKGRGVAVGSRAHLVGSAAVVQVCLIGLLKFLLLTASSAILPPKPTHALLPSSTPASHTTCHGCYPRHTVRLQALLARVSSLYYTIHAFRRMDL